MVNYTQLFNENNFPGANSNPADPAKWTTAFAPVQIFNHFLEPGSGFGAANYTGTAAPNDQYIDTTVNLSVDSLIQVVLRSDASQNNCYVLSMLDIGGGFSDSYIAKYIDGNQNNIVDIGHVRVSQGDVFRFAAFGTSLAAFRNGVLIAFANDSLYTSGFWGYFLESSNGGGPSSNLQISNVVGGSVSGTGVMGQIGSVISCSSSRGDTWSIVYQYQQDSGASALYETVVSKSGPVFWNADDTQIAVSAPGSSTQILLDCPELIKFATFGVPFSSSFWKRTDSNSTDSNFQYPSSPLDSPIGV